MALNLLERIAEKNFELTKSERKVAAAVLGDPNRTMTENIAKLAKRAGVSEPTVFRFCKTFGAQGFPDFKLALSGAVSLNKVLSSERIALGDSIEDLIDKVSFSAVNALKKIGQELDPKALAKAVDVLSKARRIAVFAAGTGRGCALNFCADLLDLGIASENFSDPLQMKLNACTLQQGDAAVALTLQDDMEQTAAAAGFAKEAGAFVIAITPRALNWRNPADCILKFVSEPDTEANELQTLSLQLALSAVLGILCKGVSLRRAESVKALKPRLDRARGLSPNESAERDGFNGRQILRADVPITALNWDYKKY